MPDTVDPFESPRLLIAGARRHIDTLKARIEEYRLAAGAISTPVQQGPPLPLTMVIRPAHPLPADFKQIAFDVVSNLRSALDHAVYASAVQLLGGEPASTKFPFGDSPDEARGEVKRRLKHLPVALTEYLLAFQPYPTGNRLLWALNKLRNTKSHRLLVPMIANLAPTTIGESEPGLITEQPTWDPHTGILKMPFQPSSTAPASMVAISIGIEIQIGTGAFLGEPAIALFDRLLGEVERVVSGIEAETARLLSERGG